MQASKRMQADNSVSPPDIVPRRIKIPAAISIMDMEPFMRSFQCPRIRSTLVRSEPPKDNLDEARQIQADAGILAKRRGKPRRGAWRGQVVHMKPPFAGNSTVKISGSPVSHARERDRNPAPASRKGVRRS